jgi:hypothetical protein
MLGVVRTTKSGTAREPCWVSSCQCDYHRGQFDTHNMILRIPKIANEGLMKYTVDLMKKKGSAILNSARYLKIFSCRKFFASTTSQKISVSRFFFSLTAHFVMQ